jgi:hypothetical protein
MLPSSFISTQHVTLSIPTRPYVNTESISNSNDGMDVKVIMAIILVILLDLSFYRFFSTSKKRFLSEGT